MESSTSGETGRKSRLIQTAILNIAFMVALGLVDGLRGPTLLDIAELFSTHIDKLSIIFLTTSIGSVVGSFFTGVIMDKFSHHRCFILFGFTVGIAITSTLIPYAHYLVALYAIYFALGFGTGSLDTGGNVLCLNIWRGLDGGPYMHSIHFSYSAGAFLAPLLAKPFLSTRAQLIGTLEANGTDQQVIEELIRNSTNMEGAAATGESQITVLYPLVGAMILVASSGFLYYGLLNLRVHKKSRKQEAQSDSDQNNRKPAKSKTRASAKMMALVFTMALFFLLYVGVEVTLGTYITAFAVNSKLKLTKLVGADLTAIFWGCFALMRFLAIFAAIKLNPSIIMILSFVLCLGGGTLLVFFAESSLLILQVCIGVMGFGMASIYATGLLWLEQYIKISNRVGAVMSIASSIGPDIFPILVGQFIEQRPMFLMQLTLATVVVCVALFILASWLGVQVKKEKEQAAEMTLAEMTPEEEKAINV